MSVNLYRNDIARLTEEKADLEKRFSDENKKIAGI